MMPACRIERITDYMKRRRHPGERVFLVDRLWPRGIRKDALDVDGWFKEIGPGDDLRKWFAHDRAKWEEFRRRYIRELQEDEGKHMLLDELRRIAKAHDLTLLFYAKDPDCNQARVIQELIGWKDREKGV